MKTQKFLKMITLAFGLLSAGFSFGLNGDIFEIKPCDENGKPKDYQASITKPLTSGEVIYFNVRLIGRDYVQGSSNYGRWSLEYKGDFTTDEYVASIASPLKLGIYVSGKVQYATLHDWKVGGQDGTSRFTDLIFKYVTKPGDMALPIVLETKSGPANDKYVEDASYCLYNLDKWTFKNYYGDQFNAWFWDLEAIDGASQAEKIQWAGVNSPDSEERVLDYSLAKCNFYVQTVDFDDVWQVAKGEAGALWRSVHANSTITADGLTPRIKAVAALTEKTTLYVWSDNENAVKVKSNTENRTIDLKTDDNGTVVPTQVGTITIAGGQIYADFQIVGAVDGQNRTANLILSPWSNYNYSATISNQRIIDYVTVPVKCLEPLPPTVTVEADRQIAYANGNYMVYGAVLNVYLSQAYDKDMVVTVTPTFSDGQPGNIGDYLRFSDSQTEVTALPDYNEAPKVTIPAGSTAKKSLYVFILRGDARTTGTSRIVFTPSVEDPLANAFIGNGANIKTSGMQIVAEKPVITLPEEGATFVGICGSETPLNLVVEDTFADSSDYEEGYQILVKYRPTDMWTTLDGTYCVGEGGALYKIDDDATGLDRKSTVLPTLNYPVAGEGIQSKIKVRSPISGKESEERNFIANIKAPRTTTVVEVNGTKNFNEGEVGTFRITLSEPNDTGDTVYAFLKASKTVKNGMVQADFVICEDTTDFTQTTGLPINRNQSEVEDVIIFLDGTKLPSGLRAQFEVVLCTTEQYNENKIIPGYDSNYLNLNIYNQEPVIKRIEMNGNESEADGYTFPNRIPKGMEREFVAIVTDKGAYDITTTESGKEFQCKWTVKLNGTTYQSVDPTKPNPITIDGNPKDNKFKFNFPQAGNWNIRLQVKDKDMDDWSEADYEVNVNVLDNPLVEITADNVYTEDDKGKSIQIGLSYWDDAYTRPITAKVEVVNWVNDDVNYGRFKLDSAFHLAGDPENIYTVALRSADPVSVRITELDGTEKSSINGFRIKAYVVTTDTLPTSQQPANVYYLETDKQVLVNNKAPHCVMDTLPNTNRWEVSGGVCKNRPIKWTLRADGDVKNDFEGQWADVVTNGLKITVFGPVNAQEFYVKEPKTETFYPDFGDLQGDVDVTFLIEDKDGGSETYVYQYTVKASKFLITSANGPGGGLSTSPLSGKYSRLGTLGEGHTYAKDTTFSSANNYRLTWNCGTRGYVEVYAFGYKVKEPIDNGQLDGGFDIPLTSTGAYQSQTGEGVDFYTYPAAGLNYNEKKDSFFYCWLLHSTDKEGKVESTLLGNTFSPEVLGKVATGRVTLPTEMTQDGNYVNTEVEAIFAKEYLPEDNAGDINLDGIPDLFAHRDWAAGNLIKLATGGEEVDNNLVNIAKFNGDGDRLPKIYQGGQNNFNYAPIGPAFTARLEIRGFHEGLNAVDLTKSEPRFCDINNEGKAIRNDNDDEYNAWLKYKEAQWAADRDAKLAENPDAEIEPFNATMMPTNHSDLLAWSPEPSGKNIKRMDPTVEDTDDDGFPDGWEYYLWYRAHVTALANDDKVFFEEFDSSNILKGKAISAEKVKERFNPCEPLSSAAYDKDPDFDNDGLSDLEELAIGTNPCHWDTDGDRMCDTWEVMMGLDPMTPDDKDANADRDFMAYFDLDSVPHVKTGERKYVFYPQLVKGVDYNYEEKEEGDKLVPDLSTFTFLKDVKTMKLTVTIAHDVNKDPETDEDYFTLHRYGAEGDGGIWGKYLVDTRLLVIEYEEFKEGVLNPIPGIGFGGTNLMLIHDQVRKVFGFDPRTAWNNVDGYVASRWDPNKNKQLGGGDMTGVAVNTIPYTAYDEYLVMRYRHIALGVSFSQNTNDHWKLIWNNTTNPNIQKEEIIDTSGNSGAGANNGSSNTSTNDVTSAATNVANNITQTTTNTTSTGSLAELLDKAFGPDSNKSTRKNHGADTDGDGVPDGWELYMGRNPSKVVSGEEDGIGKKDAYDFDGDDLSYAAEFAGTDSCNAYRNCASIYRYHPGNTGNWFNKFFPTNPGNLDDLTEAADTDGDGINDGDEGRGFPGDFYNAGNLEHELELSFIYGKPKDSDLVTCIRGGGMNPCTVDTDLDGIPDGWEMQHAGIPVNTSTKKVVSPLAVETEDSKYGGIRIAEGTFVADGIYKDAPNNVIYLAGGMDATWPGDGGSDIGEKGASWDEALGRARDVDFDHDGLQNYQEYLIQSVRHFRYDDVTTPLMGRLMSGSDGGYTQKFKGYVTFDPANVTNFVSLAKFAWGFNDSDIENRENLVKDSTSAIEPWTEEGWRNLGYFAPPPKAWDRAIVSGAIKAPLYMFPITKKMSFKSATAGYATTDPRLIDSDGDGMDDFYEMFHGLNPILGTSPVEPWESQWAYFGKYGDLISATYNQAISEEMLALGVASSSLTTFNAYNNAWTRSSFNQSDAVVGNGFSNSIEAPAAYDAVKYPWLQGTAVADSDGDGMRNDEERIIANVADPMSRHTDPTPLWFTERTTPLSFVSQYYVAPLDLASMPWYPATKTVYQTVAYTAMSSLDYMFSFEEGEGYDTDGDFKYDGAEVVTGFTRETDPLRFDDPNRRQALWLPGENGYVFSPQAQGRLMNSEDLLKQFTVECWVCPEKEGAAQTIIDRAFLYAGDHLNSDALAIRANFRIGLSEEGKIYGMFDNNKGIESGLEAPASSQYVWGPKLNKNEWAHVALTFDGSTLKLYIDGEVVTSANTKLIPANGVTQIFQEPADPDNFTAKSYYYQSGGLFIGARPVKADNVDPLIEPEDIFDLEFNTGFHNVREFFGGYVDEVRIWDGARTEMEIKENYRKRFGFEDAIKNRDSVLNAWIKGATRNNNDGFAMLPTELIFHYNFVTLPGAADPKWVAKTPAGFEKQIAKVDKLEDICASWWAKSPLKSTVYTDYRIIPWIKNTVQHVVPPDGSAIDSFIYSDQFGSGYTLAATNGLRNYTFNNSAQPYSSYVLHLDLYQKLLQAEKIVEQYGDAYQLVLDYNHFNLRGTFQASTDLIPLGGAYAKTCKKMWDGYVGDAWELTGSDTDADGLPNWWEEYCKNNYSGVEDPGSFKVDWNTIVERNGVKMTAGEAYKLDMFAGMQPGKDSIDSEYASNVDSDNDFIPDWWERMYGDTTKFSNIGDADGDGLSDYVEYILSFERNYGVMFSPINARSVNESELDYFFKVADDDNYVGAMFTDHDMIEDAIEAFWGSEFMDRAVWDAFADRDEDGWSNFAEARHNDFSSRRFSPSISHYYVDDELNDMPIPVLDLTLRYNGSQVVHSAPIQVEVYSDSNLEKADVKYALNPGFQVNKSYYVGPIYSGVMRGNLAPGHIIPNSVEFYIRDVKVANMVKYVVKGFGVWFGYNSEEYGEYLENTGDGWVYLGTKAQVQHAKDMFGEDRVEELPTTVNWIRSTEFSNTSDVNQSKGEFFIGKAKVGDIDYESGAFIIDLTKITNIEMLGAPSDRVRNLDATILKLQYTSRIPTEQSNKLRVCLGEAETGHVKEGKNTIVAFYDLNGDGAYTPGEPMGVASGVDVGWRQGAAEIELTDTSAIITRGDLLSGATDRGTIWGVDTSDVTHPAPGASNGGVYQRVRLVRALINGTAVTELGLDNKVVFDKVLNLSNRPYLFEGDIFTNDELDLDWMRFSTEVMNASSDKSELSDPTEVAYAVVFGDGEIDFANTNSFYSVMTVRKFDSVNSRDGAYVVSPDDEAEAVVYESRPTFKWRMQNGNSTYTAFKVQILDEAKAVVWDSGMRAAPARDSEGTYTFEADAYVGNELELNKSYTWRVSMYNAKFTTDRWSSEGKFKMLKPELDNAYGIVPVNVKYFGPSTVASASTYVVEAYTTPDFTGTPVARVKVASGESVEAMFSGLRAGEYYIMAYADMDVEGLIKFNRDSVEPWGYLCARGTAAKNIYKPVAITVEGGKTADVVEIYLEDIDANNTKKSDAQELLDNQIELDSDGDGMPDWWEKKYGIFKFSGSDDVDNDGVTNLGEYLAYKLYGKELSPVKAMSDGNTLDYFVEIKGGFNAGEIFARDADCNGLPDFWENILTEPTASSDVINAYKSLGDIDENGLANWWEIKYNIVGLTGEIDSDNDGLTNAEEYILSEVYNVGKIFKPVVADSVETGTLDSLVVVGGIEAGEYFLGGDKNNNNLPDWWEATNADKTLADFIADVEGNKLKDTLDKSDIDGDYMPYSWEKQYGIIDESDTDDHDGDGLSNLLEYYLTKEGVATFDPTNAKSVDANTLDYFFKKDGSYVGQIYTDHDFIDDVMEDAWGKAYSDSEKWDATSDKDEDGWSNFAEARYNEFVKSIVAPYASHIVGDSEIKDMPIPTLKLTLRYNGNQVLANGGDEESAAPAVVVQTYTDDNLIKSDATFTVQPGVESANTVYIGAWDDKTVVGTLTPGYVSAASFKLEFAQVATDKSYTFFVGDLTSVDAEAAKIWESGYYTESYETYIELLKKFGPQFIVLQSGSFNWSSFLDANAITVTEEGSICLLGGRIGKVDLKSGDYTLDLGPLQNIMTQSGTNATDTVFNIKESLLRLSYNSKMPVLQNNKMELYLGETATGYVKEGKNTIVAFYDLNGDGAYTPGEPMGVASGVDVGWRQGAAEIELTDTSAIITRGDLLSGATDRGTIWGVDTSDVTHPAPGASNGGVYQRVRLVRALINGTAVTELGLDNKVVFDKVLNLSNRPYLFEGDIFTNDELDLDWMRFSTEVMNASSDKSELSDPTEVAYAVVFGDGEIDFANTNSFYSVMTVRKFDSVNSRDGAYVVSPDDEAEAVVYESRPTFKWRMQNGNSTYTAFKVQILDEAKAVVWDSGMRAAPARDSEGTYTFEADAYVGNELELNKSYTWRVSMYNAKFTTDRWSSEGKFKMLKPELDNAYGIVPVNVKYFGPSTVASASTYVVEAYTTPDFTGTPVARVKVASGESVEAMFSGLRAGEYYIMAYADMDVEGLIKFNRDSVEPWGYLCARGTAAKNIYKPVAITVEGGKTADVVEIYLEDIDANNTKKSDAQELLDNQIELDSDGDGMPDWWEKKYGIFKFSGSDDVDNDGVTNLGEYLAYKLYGKELSPVKAMSDGNTLDYFVEIKGGFNAGEIFARDADCNGLPDFWENILTEPTASSDVINAYKSLGDIDENGLANWWEIKYNIVGLTGEIDSDNDGLTNAEEYILSEVYNVGKIFKPVVADSVETGTLDSLVVVGGIEAGEYFLGGDKNNNNLPDWWEATNADKTLADFIADVEGNKLKDTLDKSDIDGDYMPYSWEKQYGIIDESDTDDHDGDGLDNWAEYILTEIFDLKDAKGNDVVFDPTKAKSVNDFYLDYFFKIGDLYAGEIFTDHDFIDDKTEDAWGRPYANRYAWDANSDIDEDGWSNFAEARYNEFVRPIEAPGTSHIVGDTEVKDMPIPTLKLTLRYNGNQPLTGDDQNNSQGGNTQGGVQVSGSLAKIIVQTFTGSDLIKPDATFAVQPGQKSENTAYIGSWGEKTISGTLTPGYVDTTSLKIQFAEVDRNDTCSVIVGNLAESGLEFDAELEPGLYNMSYERYAELYSKYGSEYIVLQSGEFAWAEFSEANDIIVSKNTEDDDASIRLEGGDIIGTINTKTGDYTMDLGPLQYVGARGTNETQSVISMKQMVLRFKYSSLVPALQSNKMELYLGETPNGYVKEGKNTIVAFYDLDGDGKYTPGEPMGTAVGVDVGWRQGKTEIELTDTNPIITRINLETGVSDRNHLWGDSAGRDITNSIGRLMVNEYVRVRVVRTSTIIRSLDSNNGLTEKLFDVDKRRVVVDKVLNKSQRPYLFEGDILAQGSLDLDWDELYNEVIKYYADIEYDLTDIVYEVYFEDVMIPEPGQVSPADNVFKTLLVRPFDSTEGRPTPQAISAGLTGVEVYSPNPVFKWKMPNNHNGYTAFKIEIRSKSDGSLVWTSGSGGYLPAPARDANGIYTYEADTYIGDKLKNFESYSWRVSMYNAKFKDDKWSNECEFKMNVPENAVGYASIPVGVKYFGPKSVADNSTFVVEAFTTPDFTGIPAARAVVGGEDAESVTKSDAQLSTNAVLKGLMPGKYFLRAYADCKISNTNSIERQRDFFESWGYACNRGEPSARSFSPVGFNVTDRNGFEPPINIYIEDVDTNGNSLPDAWEYVENKGKLNDGVEGLDKTIVNAFGISEKLTDKLQEKVNTDVKVDGYNSYITTTLASPKMMALALGYNPNDVTFGANGAIQVESKVESVEIKSVSFDTNGNVVIEIDGELNIAENDANALGFIPVEGKTEKTVTCQVLWKASLSDADWTVKATKTIVVGNGAQTIDIDGLGSQSSGFFKVVVTE